MGFFRSLFYDGKKCYTCGYTDTEWVGSKRDLSAFPENVASQIIDMAYSVREHYGRDYDVYYCRNCNRYIIDFPSTSDIRGTQCNFTWKGKRLK